MNIDPSIFKSYDIRAIYPDQMDEEKIVPIVKAIYTLFQQQLVNDGQLNILLTRDMRVSSPSLFEVAKKTLLEMGAHVIDAGLLSTPSFYFAVFNYGYDGGIQISASHNPKEYNGLKIARKDKTGLVKIGKPTGMEDVKKMVLENYPFRTAEKPGYITEQTGILEDEVENALKIVGNPEISEFKIVADPANAMGATYLEALFKKVKANLVRMNFELDGTFPAHQPDPLQPQTLVDLQKKVIEEKADLGLAPDGDGDRLFFIDEKGQIVPPTSITSIVARELLDENPGAEILFDIRYILTPQKIVEEHGGKSDITKVGHAYITEKMSQTGALFAGESSAHFFFKATGNGEGPLGVVLTVLKVMTREKKTLSQLSANVRRSFESGEINFKVSNASEIMNTIKEQYKDGKFWDLDGVAISYPTWRFSLRTSNTEPLLRLNVEGYDKDEMMRHYDELVAKIKELGKE